MPNKISGSSNIAVLDSRIIADLCLGKFYIDATPSLYIGGGAGNVLGAKVKVENPYGVVVKDFSPSYEIMPSLPSGMNTVIEFNVPLQASNYQWGKYIITVKLIDSDSKEYSIIKTFDLKCIPNADKYKYGTIGATLSGSCKDGKVSVIVDQPPVYNGSTSSSQVAGYTLEYPSGSGLANTITTTGNFSAVLSEGVYSIYGETCATYNLGDNLFAKIKYKLNTSKNIRCGINECSVRPAFQALTNQLTGHCTEEERYRVSSIILEALNLFKLIQLNTECGFDVSDLVVRLQELLGIQDEEIGTVVVNENPSSDVLILGCGYDVAVVGLTTTYTINNYTFNIEVEANSQQYIVAGAATINGCTKTQVITFDLPAVYADIKNIINSSSEEKKYWASVIKQGLDVEGIDWTIIGLTPSQAANMNFSQLLNYLLGFVKECCECLAVITSHSATNVGEGVTIAWAGQNLFAIEVYVDSVLYGTVLSSATSFTMPDLADSETHQYTLIPKNSNGKSCTPVAGSFSFFGCAAINPPSLSTSVANNVACPYDLTQLVAGLPLGITAEWHNANNTNVSSLVGNPAAVGAGVYFAFAKDANGCYSTGVQVTVTCEAAISCTAPQNLTVTPVTGGLLVQFQSATEAPPTYRVRRRLKSAADIDANYTIIGTPAWNATTNRWDILDTTAVNNTLYVYKAESMCANNTKPALNYDFANLICPVVTITENETSIGYSFVNAGGGVDRYEVTLYDTTGLTSLFQHDKVPVFTNPITGTFTPLAANTNFKLRVVMFIGGVTGYKKECAFENVDTAPIDVCPDITGIGGEGFGGTNV